MSIVNALHSELKHISCQFVCILISACHEILVYSKIII